MEYEGGMLLGEVIEVLKRRRRDEPVVDGFCRPHSYRGYYDCLGFAPCNDTTVGAMLDACEAANGATYQGWKGGDFEMGLDTEVYIAQEGTTGRALTRERLDVMLGDLVSRADLADLRAEVERLRSFVSESLPFLEEAWAACFQGQEERLLSAEQRGMGRLMRLFREVAEGRPALPPGVVTEKEAGDRVENAVAWMHKTLGDPNALVEPLDKYVLPGDTCADGIRRAHKAVAAALKERDEAREKMRALKDESFGVCQRNDSLRARLAAAEGLLDECLEAINQDAWTVLTNNIWQFLFPAEPVGEEG